MRYFLLLAFSLIFVFRAPSVHAQDYDYASEASAACEVLLSQLSPGDPPEAMQCQWRDKDSGWCDQGFDCYRIFYYWTGPAIWYGLFGPYTYGQHCHPADTDCPSAPVTIAKNAGETCGPTCGFGDPINPATGNKYEIKTEYATPSGGLLTFGWTYNSQTLALAGQRTWPLGANRTHNYLRKITLNSTSPATASVFREDGKVYTYTSSGGVWSSDPDVVGVLTATTDINGQVISWSYLNASNETETYAADGKLLSIASPSDKVQFTYDLSGKLASVTDHRGRALQFVYSGQRVSSVFLPDGGSVAFDYDANANLIKVTHPGGQYTQYAYNEASFTDGANMPSALTGVIDESLGRYSDTYYNLSGFAVGTELAGDVDRYRAVYETASDGSYFQSVAVITPMDGMMAYAFGAQHGVPRPRLLETLCGSGCVGSRTNYAFDSAGRVSGMTRNGVVTTYAHNPRGLQTQRVEASNDATGKKRTTQTDWHADYRVPTERRVYDAANVLIAKSTWTYNPRGQVLTSTQTDPATSTSRTTTSTYCEQADLTNGTCPLLGLVTSINGPRTDVADTTTYTYYASDDASCASSPTTCPHHKGDLWKVTDALGRISETLAYDGAGRVLSVKDANNVVTDFTYHPRGWLTARKVRGTNNSSETDDQITAIEYWPTGLVKKVTQPDGAFTSYSYDAAHRLTGIEDNAGNTIEYVLDNAGNRTAEYTFDSGTTLKRALTRVYGQLSELQTVYDAYNHATGFTYDANGNNQTVTDALNRVADNDYDPLNRLVRTLQDVGGIEAETKFAYDAQDNLTQVTDPKGLDTTYTYNGFSDLTQLSSPDTGITSYTYDSAGNRKTQTDARNITATYSYDALNRLTGIAYPTSSLDVAYAYDTVNAACIAGETFAVGRLTKMTDGSGNTEYCYDRFGNLTRKRQTTNGQVFELRYAYTKAGQLQAMTYPDGAVVDYVRDGQGRTTEVGVTPNGGARQILLNQAAYYPFGPIAGWTYGNGRTMSRTLNQNYQPLAIEDPNAGGLSLGYAFDEIGNLKTLYNADQSIAKAQYGYDALNRLTDVKDGPTGTVIDHYAYDATGNRISFTNAGGTTNYTYPGTNHRLTNVGATARTYDNVGNTTQIGGTAKEFVYNDAGRMSQVKVGGTPAMNYQLSGRGEQVRKYLNANNIYTVYNEAGQWVGDYDASGNPIQQAVWLDDLPVGLLAGGTTNQKLRYLQPDHLGTPRAVIDTTANTAIWRWDLEGEAFGNTVPNQDPDNNGTAFVFNMRFPGQGYDSASGLHYNLFRDGYETATGRYTQSDPIGVHGGIGTYVYAYNRPGLLIDELGLASSPAIPAPGSPVIDIPWDKIQKICRVNPWGIGIGLMLYSADAGSCSTVQKTGDCEQGDDKLCEEAKAKAKLAYNELRFRTIPQYMYATRHGAADGGHYKAILEGQRALKNAISRVRYWCKQLPPEIESWERLASQEFPIRH